MYMKNKDRQPSANHLQLGAIGQWSLPGEWYYVRSILLVLLVRNSSVHIAPIDFYFVAEVSYKVRETWELKTR